MKGYLIILGFMIVVAAGTVYADEPAAMPAAEKKVDAAKAVYVCPDCHTMAMAEGKCSKCGMEMKQMHLLGVKDGKVTVCACGADCKCDATTVKDGKCSCGKEVMTMSAKGMYVCACGGKCCSTISDKPGKCSCGADLKKAQ